MKGQGELKSNSRAQPGQQPSPSPSAGSCALLALEEPSPFAAFAMAPTGVVSQPKVTSSVFITKAINCAKLLLTDKKVATNTFPFFFNFSKERQRIGWEKRTC